jgi:hypothetical protein
VTTPQGESFSLRLDDAQGRDAGEYGGYMQRKFLDCVEDRFDAAAGEHLVASLLDFEHCTAIDSIMDLLADSQATRSPEHAS